MGENIIGLFSIAPCKVITLNLLCFHFGISSLLLFWWLSFFDPEPGKHSKLQLAKILLLPSKCEIIFATLTKWQFFQYSGSNIGLFSIALPTIAIAIVRRAITLERKPLKKKQRMQRILRAITLQGAIEKSPILL